MICMVAEEEVQPEDRQLALRPADMSFEQAMLHYMAQMNDRQVFLKALPLCVSWLSCCGQTCQSCLMQCILQQGARQYRCIQVDSYGD